jgi:hypothetical protein
MIKDLHTSLFEQGKIKIGGKGELKKSKNGSEYRESLKFDYFLITTLEKGKDDNFKKDDAAMKDLPENPRSLPVELLYDSIDLNFPTCYSIFNQDGIFCRGDGETAERQGKEIVCDRDTCKYAKKNTCKVGGILSCRLPHLKTLGGVYKFRTHSWNSVKNIVSALQYLQTLTGGILAGLPLELRLEQKPTKFGLVKIVNIVFPGDQDALAEALEKEIARRQRLNIDISKVENRAAEAGVMEDTDDPEDVAEEFFPDEKEPEKTAVEEQKDIQAALEKGWKAIRSLWNEYRIGEDERKASIKKHFHIDSGDLKECRDIKRLRDYYKSHRKQYAATKESDIDGFGHEEAKKGLQVVCKAYGEQSEQAMEYASAWQDENWEECRKMAVRAEMRLSLDGKEIEVPV